MHDRYFLMDILQYFIDGTHGRYNTELACEHKNCVVDKLTRRNKDNFLHTLLIYNTDIF